MRADADRIGEDLKVAAQPLGKGASEGFELASPWIAVPRRFELQLKEPCPAVRPLEAAAEGAIEIGELCADILAGEGLVRELRDRRGFLDVRKQPPQRQQRPPAVDAAVPVETAVKDRVKHARRQRVRVAR